MIQTHTIPRGQTALAMGKVAPDVRSFELECLFGSATNGTCSNPFLEQNLKTLEFRIKVDINDDGTWSYEQNTVSQIRGRDALFHHTDRNTMHTVGESIPNWVMGNR